MHRHPYKFSEVMHSRFITKVRDPELAVEGNSRLASHSHKDIIFIRELDGSENTRNRDSGQIPVLIGLYLKVQMHSPEIRHNGMIAIMMGLVILVEETNQIIV